MEPERPPQPSPTPQSWQPPVGLGPTYGYGEAPPLGSPPSSYPPSSSYPPAPSYAPPSNRRGLLGGILGIFAPLVVGVIVVCVIAFFALRDAVTGTFDDMTSAFGGGTPATVVMDGEAITVEQAPICHKDSDGMIRMSIDSSQGISVTLRDGEPLKVMNVNLKHDGILNIYTPSDKGSATVTRDGDNFKIVGNMSSRGGVPTGTFEIYVTCSP